jgi:hypothetical protein
MDQRGKNPDRQKKILNKKVGGKKILVEARFFVPSRPALGPTQPHVQWVPVLSPEVKRPGSCVNTHPPLALRLKKEKSYTSTPPLGRHGLLYMYLPLLLNLQ